MIRQWNIEAHNECCISPTSTFRPGWQCVFFSIVFDAGNGWRKKDNFGIDRIARIIDTFALIRKKTLGAYVFMNRFWVVMCADKPKNVIKMSLWNLTRDTAVSDRMRREIERSRKVKSHKTSIFYWCASSCDTIQTVVPLNGDGNDKSDFQTRLMNAAYTEETAAFLSVCWKHSVNFSVNEPLWFIRNFVFSCA